MSADESLSPGIYPSRIEPKATVLSETLEVSPKGECLLLKTVRYEYRDPYGDSYWKVDTRIQFPITAEDARTWQRIQTLPADAIAQHPV